MAWHYNPGTLPVLEPQETFPCPHFRPVFHLLFACLGKYNSVSVSISLRVHTVVVGCTVYVVRIMVHKVVSEELRLWVGEESSPPVSLVPLAAKTIHHWPCRDIVVTLPRDLSLANPVEGQKMDNTSPLLHHNSGLDSHISTHIGVGPPIPPFTTTLKT
ncbi:hypothetical protein BR93DRAFT_79501 [Coniochaeta sp. PMI_546]|nr:hypothetical protein BR93DRAFT_79501 [Coniochaeta sp. PMI_546]